MCVRPRAGPTPTELQIMARDHGQAVPPPPDIAMRPLPLRDAIGIARDWYRIGKTKFSPIFYTQDSGWRFSAPTMPGTLYLGDSPEACFWEVFWDDLISRPENERRLDDAKVRARSLWRIKLPAAFHIVDTTDPDTLNEIGAHGGTFSGPYAICQQWAAELRTHPANPDGLCYESARRKGRKCLALFSERTAASAWSLPGDGTPLPESAELAALLVSHGFKTLRTAF